MKYTFKAPDKTFFATKRDVHFSCFSTKNKCHEYSLEVPCQVASNEYPQYMFSLSNKKNITSLNWRYETVGNARYGLQGSIKDVVLTLWISDFPIFVSSKTALKFTFFRFGRLSCLPAGSRQEVKLMVPCLYCTLLFMESQSNQMKNLQCTKYIAPD